MPDEAGEKAAREILEKAKSARPGRSAARAALRRRLEPARRCRRPAADGGAQGADRPAAEERRRHPGDEHGAQAPLGDPGRAPRRRVARAGGRAHHLGRDRRRSDAHRLGAVRRRSHHVSPTRKRDPRRYGTASTSVRPVAAEETPKPGDPSLRRSNKVIATAHRSLEAAAEVFAARRHPARDPRRHVTGEAPRSAKVMAALVREIRSHGAMEAAGGAHLRRRMHGHDQRRRRPRRALRRVPALARNRNRRRLGDRLRHRRHRRLRGQRRRDPDARTACGAGRDAKAHARAGTTATDSSARSATWSSPGRRAPTSTTTARSSSPRRKLSQGVMNVRCVRRTNDAIIARWKPSSTPPNSSPPKGCSTTPRSRSATSRSGGAVRDLEETARWYAEVLGAQPVRILKDRVTLSFGGVHAAGAAIWKRRSGVDNPRAYPRAPRPHIPAHGRVRPPAKTTLRLGVQVPAAPRPALPEDRPRASDHDAGGSLR